MSGQRRKLFCGFPGQNGASRSGYFERAAVLRQASISVQWPEAVKKRERDGSNVQSNDTVVYGFHMKHKRCALKQKFERWERAYCEQNVVRITFCRVYKNGEQCVCLRWPQAPNLSRPAAQVLWKQMQFKPLVLVLYHTLLPIFKALKKAIILPGPNIPVSDQTRWFVFEEHCLQVGDCRIFEQAGPKMNGGGHEKRSTASLRLHY